LWNKESVPEDPRCAQVFISYAWSAAHEGLARLQTSLLHIVKDLKWAGIQVLLDILNLKINSDINKFMIDGVESSDSILWSGTPKLKLRISFTPDGKPSNPATFEFDLILSKIKEHPNSLIPLWLLVRLSTQPALSPPTPNCKQMGTLDHLKSA
jgi:hypothetical protein